MAMSTVTPIRPSDAALPGRPILEQRIQAERDAIFEVSSMIELVTERLNDVSGDEDGVEIAQLTSTLSDTLRGALRLQNAVAERLESVLDGAQPGEREQLEAREPRP